MYFYIEPRVPLVQTVDDMPQGHADTPVRLVVASEGLPSLAEERLGVPGAALHLHVRVHHDRQKHVQHEVADHDDEGGVPYHARQASALPHDRPVEVVLDDLEGREERPLVSRELRGVGGEQAMRHGREAAERGDEDLWGECELNY